MSSRHRSIPLARKFSKSKKKCWPARASGSADAESGAVNVISPYFCMGYPMDLTVVWKVMTLSEGSFGITDVNSNIIFSVKGKLLSLHVCCVLVDDGGNPIVTFQQKFLYAHIRWQVFIGESTSANNLLFSLKKSSVFQFKTNLDVFLAYNTKEELCDFRIEGSWMERSCVIYAGNSNAIIGQMHKKHNVQSILLGKETFGVTIYHSP
ncbi:hypothetical protein DH2020_000692 [Rehmannia glutinosa]|uniref:Uncharacterized protein n=1 Tax=Rehmannia glutinosa TaxID=99300 RepID=A0ABR0XXN5_REHGL